MVNCYCHAMEQIVSAEERLFNPVRRFSRHSRIWWRTMAFPRVPMPTFLILFINSICNLTCEHCFYWRNLNRRDDLTFDEIKSLSEELDGIDTLNLSGGEPFLRPGIRKDLPAVYSKQRCGANLCSHQRFLSRPDDPEDCGSTS